MLLTHVIKTLTILIFFLHNLRRLNTSRWSQIEFAFPIIRYIANPISHHPRTQIRSTFGIITVLLQYTWLFYTQWFLRFYIIIQFRFFFQTLLFILFFIFGLRSRLIGVFARRLRWRAHGKIIWLLVRVLELHQLLTFYHGSIGKTIGLIILLKIDPTLPLRRSLLCS